MAQLKFKSMRAATAALEAGFILDEKDDRLPRDLVERLCKVAFEDKPTKSGVIRSHVRYEGAREIWWFDYQ